MEEELKEKLFNKKDSIIFLFTQYKTNKHQIS